MFSGHGSDGFIQAGQPIVGLELGTADDVKTLLASARSRRYLDGCAAMLEEAGDRADPGARRFEFAACWSAQGILRRLTMIE